MRRTAWLVALAAVVALVLPCSGPAVAQVTVPGPDFNNDGFGDLAVGAPGEDVGAVANAGAGSVLFGDAADGLGGAGGSQFFFQGVSGLGGVAESFDGFGAAFS